MNTNKIRGFTLIEFMVASALAMIVIMAAGNTYLTTRKLNQSAQERIDVQNDLRNAATAISRDARVAGSFGCFISGGLVKNAAKDATAHSGSFPQVNQTKITKNPSIFMDASKNAGYGVIWTNNTTGLTPPTGGAIKSNALIFLYGKGHEPIKTINGNTLELASNGKTLENAIKEKASLVLSTCQNTQVLNGTLSGSTYNFSAASLNSDFNNNNLGVISLSQFYAAAYVIATIDGVDSLLRYDIGDNGNWQDPELLAKNVSNMDVSFAYEQNCNDTAELPGNTLNFAYTDKPTYKNLPALIQITLSYQGSAQTQYVINASVRGGSQCTNTVSYQTD